MVANAFVRFVFVFRRIASVTVILHLFLSYIVEVEPYFGLACRHNGVLYQLIALVGAIGRGAGCLVHLIPGFWFGFSPTQAK